jgi:hypothetical protein
MANKANFREYERQANRERDAAIAIEAMHSRPAGLRSEQVGAFCNKYLGQQGRFLK